MFEHRKQLDAISGFWNMPESTDPTKRLLVRRLVLEPDRSQGALSEAG